MRRNPTKRFLFRLALRLGWLNPYAMARKIPAKLLQEWEAYAAIEPFDEVRADIRTAQIAQMLYNINRDAKKEPKGRPLEDFVLDFDVDQLSEEDRQKKAAADFDEKMRIQALVLNAMALAAADSAPQPAKVIEFTYPGAEQVAAQAPVQTVSDAEQQALAKARAAIREA